MNKTSNKKSSFLPNGYTAPAGSSSFLKLEEGETKFRILTDAVIGWEGWSGGSPFRREGIELNIEENEVDINTLTKKPDIRHFWAFLVFDYADDSVKILEISQKTIMKQIEGLVNDPSWGDPTAYDITIERTDDKRTTYSVKPYPPKALTSVQQKVVDASDLDVNSLFQTEEEEKNTRDMGNFSSKPSVGQKRR